MLKTNLMRSAILFTDLLPFMKFGLNKDRIRQRRQNEDLMRDRNRAVKKSITPPVATDVDDVGDVLGVAPISDDGSVDSSF